MIDVDGGAPNPETLQGVIELITESPGSESLRAEDFPLIASNLQGLGFGPDNTAGRMRRFELPLGEGDARLGVRVAKLNMVSHALLSVIANPAPNSMVALVVSTDRPARPAEQAYGQAAEIDVFFAGTGKMTGIELEVDLTFDRPFTRLLQATLREWGIMTSVNRAGRLSDAVVQSNLRRSMHRQLTRLLAGT